MNTFQLIKSVLDDLYPEVEDGTTVLFGQQLSSRDAAIRCALQYLRNQYGALMSNSNSVDYSEAAVRFAYIYKYVTCHANLVYMIIRRTPQLQQVFDDDMLRVTALGGGPGTELLGILKYMMETDRLCKLNCTMLDRERLWGLSWNEVGPKVASRSTIYTAVQPVDVLEVSSWKPYQRLFAGTKLFTSVFFMSELHHFATQATPFFHTVIECAPSDSIFLYIDNNVHEFYSWFDSIAQRYALELIASERIHKMLIPTNEEKMDLGEYVKRFELPRLQASIAYRVVRKR